MSFNVRRPFHGFVSSREIRWRERFLLFLLLLGSALIQSSFSAVTQLYMFRPDLLLIVVVFWSLKKGAPSGFYTGLCAGLIGDIFSVGMLGLYSVSLGLVGFLVALGSHPLYRGHITTRLLMVALGAFISGITYYLLLTVFSAAPPWPLAWSSAIWPGIWQTVLIAPLWLWLTARVLR